MKRVSCYLLIITIVLAILPLQAVTTINGKVVSILDGDTVEILVGKQNYRIRLGEIDCPEKSQAYGQKAKQFTSAMCYGKVVKAKISSKDRYGRYIAEIILPDGKNLNRQLLLNGFAWHYKRYSNNIQLAALENQARSKHLGLWHDPDPIPPWQYRYQKRNSSAHSYKHHSSNK